MKTHHTSARECLWKLTEHQINSDLLYPVLNRNIAWAVNFFLKDLPFYANFILPASPNKLIDVIAKHQTNTLLGLKGPDLIPDCALPITGVRISLLFLIRSAGLFLLCIILLKCFPPKPTQNSAAKWLRKLFCKDPSLQKLTYKLPLRKSITLLLLCLNPSSKVSPNKKLPHRDDFEIRGGEVFSFSGFPLLFLS